MINYYSVLGVPHNANVEAIKLADRRKARSCLPDNGGNIEHMKVVNEAWFVLRDPDERREYDRKLNGESYDGRDAFADKAREQARAHAATYPKNSKDLDEWIDNVVSDFKSASYSSTDFLGDTLRFPTAENSDSARIFLCIGAIIGFLLPFALPYYSFKFPHTIFMHAITAAIGAWIGTFAHQAVASVLKIKDPSDRATVMRGESEIRIVECERCLQKLRLPNRKETLSVTCTRCRHPFSVQAK